MPYTLLVLDKITPKYISVESINGPVSLLNGGINIDRPDGALIYFNTSDQYSDDLTKRVELWETSTGSATIDEILYLCPDLLNDENSGILALIGTPLYITKYRKRGSINRARDNAELQPFTYLGKQFDADTVSMKRLTLAVQAAQAAILAGQTFSITWTCADNTTIDLSETQMLGTLQAMMLRGVEIHEKARGLKALIDAATTNEEVEAVVW